MRTNIFASPIPAPAPSRILVLGDVMLDLYTWGEADRVSPEAPVLVLKAEREEARLGGAGAVASLLAALGVEPIVVGVVGADGPAHLVRRLVADLVRSQAPSRGQNSHEFCHAEDAAEGGFSPAPCALFAVDGRLTTVKERLIGQTASRHGQQMLRVDRESCEPLPDLVEEKLCVAALAALDDVQAVLISDYGKGVCSPKLLADVIHAAGKRNLPVLVDPRRGADYSVYRGATLIKPNRHEAGEATGRRIHSRGEAVAAGRELCARYDFRAAVITLDADGMVLVAADDTPPLPSSDRAEGVLLPLPSAALSEVRERIRVG